MLFVLSLLVECQAYPFSIVPNGTLPTTVPPGGTVTASYVVTNNTASQRNNNFVQYLPLNVSITSGGCADSFDLVPHGQAGDSCILNLLISGPVKGSDPDPTHHLFVCFPGGIVCAGTFFPLNIVTLRSIAVTPTTATVVAGLLQQFKATGIYNDGSTQNLTASATWNSSNTAAATINNAGLATGIAQGSSLISASLDSIVSNSAILTVAAPVLVSIAVAPTSPNIIVNGTQQFTATGTYSDSSTKDITSSATWSSSSASVATINSSGLATGVSLGSTNISASLSSITSNSAALLVTQFAYVVNNSANSVSYCVLNSNGSFGICHTTTGTGNTLNSPVGIAINTSKNMAYVVNNGNNTVSYCSISSDGSFGTCIALSAGGALSFNSPQGINLDPAMAFAYITNSGVTGVGANTVYSCSISSVDGSLSSCNDTTGTGFNSPYGIVIDSTNTFAYITNLGANNVISCPIAANGLFTAASCADTTGTGFSSPALIALANLSPVGTVAYIANSSSATVSFCTVPGGGLFGTCTTSGTLFSAPFGISVKSNLAYVTNNSVTTFCVLSGTDGSLSNCNNIGSGFSGSAGIAIP